MIIRRRPVLVWPFGILIKPGLYLPRSYIRFFTTHDRADDGRWITKIVDELDREYWTRLTDRQLDMALRWWE